MHTAFIFVKREYLHCLQFWNIGCFAQCLEQKIKELAKTVKSTGNNNIYSWSNLKKKFFNPRIKIINLVVSSRYCDVHAPLI